MFNFIRKNFSPLSISIIAVAIAFVTSGFFATAALSIIAPHGSASVGRLVGEVAYTLPLIIVWIILFPILVLKIYKGSHKAFMILVILIVLVIAGNIYDLVQQRKLFTLPFMQYKEAPLTYFEKNNYEKKYNLQLYVPTYLPPGFTPYNHHFYPDECPYLRMVFQPDELYGSDVDIHESSADCDNRLTTQTTSPTKVYETIKLDSGNTLYYHVSSEDETDLLLYSHFIQIGNTVISIDVGDYQKIEISREEVVKLAQSLE